MVTSGTGADARNANNTPFKPEGLLTPAAFPHPVARLEIRETNTSYVILTGSFAYKIKKCIKFEFIDTSTLALRRHLCEEELRLNRRLAADLYLDVVAITREADSLRVGGDGEIIDYAVRMRQFDASQELSELLERREVSPREFTELAMRLAQFHGAAARAAANPDGPHTAHLRDAVLGTLAILLSHADSNATFPELGSLADWTRGYLGATLPELGKREALGFVRECHGDLHSRNVVRWRGALVPFDCLEFDPKLRWIDTMNDAAFLVMDLAAYERKDLEFSFLNAYLEHTGDYAGVRYLAFYAVYRAMVRAMVDGLGAEMDATHRQELQERLRVRVKTAMAFVKRSAATLIIMHGPSGSGKSWLSGQLIPRLGAVRIRSDLERKRLAGRESCASRDAGVGHGLYDPQFGRRTYARLFESAESCLDGGFDVIVDAAFLAGAERRLFRDLAARRRCPFLIVSCEADRGILAERIARRRRAHADPSEADVEVLDWQLQNTEPLSAEEHSHFIVVDTTAPNASQKACAAIRSRLAPPPGTLSPTQ